MERIHMQKRIIETKITSEDTEIENSLRPTHLSDYIGQKQIKESLLISIQAAKQLHPGLKTCNRSEFHRPRE